ncbi:MAG TPA: hypothetical protein VGO70_07785 [Arsenicitalea sp.]|jgi:Pyruvate/2-oxoacid:ferredoxin oxidoreductase gamma subunit|nr:hypothetical protein [Arsenicitalea sp.]
MANQSDNRGGTHEQHVRAGEQSHKNSSSASNAKSASQDHGSSTRGGTHEQHVKAGQQSHKNS